jgi:hypothetical protein
MTEPNHPTHERKPMRALRVEDATGIVAFFREYFWLVFKNVVGWIFIISAPGVGVVLPGPGGIPLFLIGFALVTFPGKRKLTARVLAGKTLPLDSIIFTGITAFVSVALTSALIYTISVYFDRFIKKFHMTPSVDVVVALGAVCLAAFIVTWAVFRLALRIVNWFVRRIPVIRKFVRPVLKRWGIDLLPTRRRLHEGELVVEHDEILKFSDQYQTRARATWTTLKPWLKRVFALTITITIFMIMIRPLQENWPAVKEQAQSFSIVRFGIASVMFALFLFAFRAMSWRRVLKGFGHKLPRAAAARIFATSELARYLPGAIWQVVGRVYLVKPYGVNGAVCSTTQVLELCVFLFANVLVASVCLLWYGAKIDANARVYLYMAMALVPALGLLLHPKIFYTIANKILGLIRREPIRKRLRGWKLIKLLGWVIIGLLWQSIAVYLITQPVLGLKPDWWWVVAGSYCLAWTAGFLAFWAPGGIGVREIVFVAALRMVLPEQIRQNIPEASLPGLLVLLGFVLRLWTIVGEVILTVAAYAIDFKGAINHPDAPGRSLANAATSAPS